MRKPAGEGQSEAARRRRGDVLAKKGKDPRLGVTRTTKFEAKTKKGKRFLESRAAQQVEYVKRLLLLYGRKTSQTVKDVLVELKHMRDRMECTHLTRKNENVVPFEIGGETSLEFLCGKTHSGCFVVGSHSKKRPNNLIFGRVYDEKVYDLLEMGVENFRKAVASEAKQVFSPKPCFAFAGEEFENDADFKQLKSVLLDSFRGRVVESINLKGVDRVIMCTPAPSSGQGEGAKKRVLLRHYAIKLKKSGTRVPRVELLDIGPSMDLCFRRSRAAPVDVEKEAVKKVDEAIKRKKVKNVSDDVMDGTVGRIWLKPQDIDAVPLKKPKGKKSRPVDA